MLLGLAPPTSDSAVLEQLVVASDKHSAPFALALAAESLPPLLCLVKTQLLRQLTARQTRTFQKVMAEFMAVFSAKHLT